ncbi:MAG TPA: hypothetical protein VFP68_11200 [Burkholderiaceae bacterium]|nr:hypothetical protein [Burkholderiaceae bacterium]
MPGDSHCKDAIGLICAELERRSANLEDVRKFARVDLRMVANAVSKLLTDARCQKALTRAPPR